MKKSEHFNFYMADKHGFVPADHYIDVEGRTARHSGNFKLYTISGFAWMGATDEWGFVHSSPEGVVCVRPMHHLWGKRDDGTMRYTDLHGVPFEQWYQYTEQRAANADEYQKLQEDYEALVNASADMTDCFLQVPTRVAMMQEHGDWIDQWVKPALCKLAKAVGHKATRCDG